MVSALSSSLVADSSEGFPDTPSTITYFRLGKRCSSPLLSGIHQDVFTFAWQTCCGHRHLRSPPNAVWVIGERCTSETHSTLFTPVLGVVHLWSDHPRLHTNARCERGLRVTSRLVCMFWQVSGNWRTLRKLMQTQGEGCETSHRQYAKLRSEQQWNPLCLKN